MPGLIEREIVYEAEKLIKRHQRYAYRLSEDLDRYEKRSGLRRRKKILTPNYWESDNGFNPYYVRAHSDGIAYAIEKSLKTGRYVPRPAVVYRIPKADGTVRDVRVFQVADQAVSRILFRRLLKKNVGRFSSRCFAYRTDFSVHDAVLHLASSLTDRPRVFIAEYDFKQYFDNLSHAHLRRILADKRFYVTEQENNILWGFVMASAYDPTKYDLSHKIHQTVGIPQRTAISMFLANIAAYPLDRALESLRVDFARYADDVLVWASDYGEICKSVDVLSQVGREMGVEFNVKKSDGVRILVEEGAKAELRVATSVDFVGYSVSSSQISIRESTVKRIKARIAFLIYSNLIEQPKNGRFKFREIKSFDKPPQDVDREYLVLMMQIRRYLYGDVTEEQLAKYLSRDIPRIRYRGLMSFYPIVDNLDQLKMLDGWMLHTVYTTIRKRAKMFRRRKKKVSGIPYGLSKAELVKSDMGSLRLPSFLRISRFLRDAARRHGASPITPSGPPS